jgi:NAD(P)-dependent dehydrogenase (short-subunit alcohol dehydrogenase family)
MAEVVVVTGASSGVGRAIASAFGRRQAKVGLVARGHDGLEGARRDVEAAGGQAVAVSADVADPEQVERAAATIEEALGPIDVWVNDAMVTVFAPFTEIEPQEFRRATEVTYLGAVWGTRAALRRMLPRNHGSIVFVGSALGFRGIPLQSAYCGAKHAVQGFFESLRTELAHRQSAVRTSIVQLPGVNTPQFDHCRSRMDKQATPVPPIYQPELCAEAVVYAAHHRRRQIYVGGSTVMTIWGNRFAPWLADFYLAKTGFQSQQTQDPPDPRNRPGNLFEPVPGDPGAHGKFDSKAHSGSAELWASLHRNEIAAAASVAGVAAAAFLLRSR